LANAPVFSVVIPAHNAASYIHESISSIRDQTFPDFELIIIDDGSTDHTAEIIRAHEQDDGRIAFFSKPHRGVAATRNEGVQLAAGRYVAFHDADDVAEPKRLELQHEYLERHPGCVALGGQLLFMDADGDPLYVSAFPTDHRDIDAAHMAGGGCVLLQGTSALLRQSVLEVGGYREQYPVAEDLDLVLRLAEVGGCANLTDVLIRYRLHPESLTHTHLPGGHEWAERAIMEARRRRGLPGSPIELPRARSRSTPTEWLHRAMKARDSGYDPTARKYARRALIEAPFNPTAWKVWLIVHTSKLRRRLKGN
jgi:glycosyltransferase involved in cell wall biosynthesis